MTGDPGGRPGSGPRRTTRFRAPAADPVPDPAAGQESVPGPGGRCFMSSTYAAFASTGVGVDRRHPAASAGTRRQVRFRAPVSHTLDSALCIARYIYVYIILYYQRG